MSLLKVDNLRINYTDSTSPVVDGLNFTLERGTSLGIVGESGSGKTQTALAIIGLSPKNAQISGKIDFDGIDLTTQSAVKMNAVRARRIAMVFQDPMTALNPYVRIGDQLRRVLLEHKFCGAREARQRTLQMLDRVGLPDPARQYRSYPHQLSGGMRQRALIGAALLGEPDLLIADEPTTALDVTVQAQILDLLRDLRVESNVALMLITHDLGVVAGNCEDVLIMQDGRLIEKGAVEQIFESPSQPETVQLISAAPRVDAKIELPRISREAEPVVSLHAIEVSYPERRGIRRNRLRAVRSLDLELRAGETIAVVGESGSGKTSLARAVLGLLPPDAGSVSFLGAKLPGSVGDRTNDVRRNLQMVFQDPLESLNPSMRVSDIVAEPLHVHCPEKSRTEKRTLTRKVLQEVGLDSELADRLPHELSGGQAQRVAIARALVLEPDVLVCDEAVAALDGTVQHEILMLLREVQQRSKLAIMFITHDLAVVRLISHRILVMYMGRICELADNESLFTRPRHPYTKALLNAVPIPDPKRTPPDARLAGDPASIINPPEGCSFHPRCPHAIAVCAERIPVRQNLSRDAAAACHRAIELDLSY